MISLPGYRIPFRSPCDVAAMGRATIPEVVRFVRLIQVRGANECWSWLGGRDDGGYGLFRRISGKQAIASRVSYELLIGPFDPSLDVLHRCDHPNCVNPNHLFLGTAADNARDMAAKGRDGNSRKTHCRKGHPYDESNTYLRADKPGHRGCRTCRNEASNRYRNRRDIADCEDMTLRGKFAVVTGGRG